MKCTLHSPSFLIRNAHSYCFRLIIPMDLRKIVGQTELRYTLRTGYLGVAKEKARFLSGRVKLLYRLLRREGGLLAGLTKEKIQEIVQAYLKRNVIDLESFYSTGETPLFESIKEFDEDIAGLKEIRDEFFEALKLGNHKQIEPLVDGLLAEHGIADVEKWSPDYIKLNRELLRNLIRSMDREIELFSNQVPAELPAPQPVPPTPDPPDSLVPKKSKVTVGRVLEEYWAEREPSLKPRSKTEVRRALEHLIEFVGKDSDIREIDGESLRRYKQKLTREEIAPGKCRSVKTVNDKYLTFQKTFFTWAKNNSYVTQNPVEGLSIKERKDKRPDEEQDPFIKDDLKMMFVESPEYGHDRIEKPHQFWLPLIGLYTGMRIEEISQLYASDLKQIDGVWCLDINEDKPDKSVKTSERRIVPLHPFLAEELNFVGYVKGLPDQDGRIFPELKRIKNRYSHHASPWFSDFKQRCGVVAPPRKKTFHSFRHTVIDHLLQKDIQDRIISMLVGHSIQGQTKGRYGKRLKAKMLLEKAVLHIDYGIDLSHLKNSKWVVR